MPLQNIPLGTLVHNVNLSLVEEEKLQNQRERLQLMAKKEKYALLKMPSGELRKVRLTCMATIGTVGNEDHINEVFGKAGKNSWLGIRPKVRVWLKTLLIIQWVEEKEEVKDIFLHLLGDYPQGYKTRRGKKQSDKFIVRKRSK